MILVVGRAGVGCAIGIAAAVRTRETADANALRDFQAVDSNAYMTIAAAQATLDRDYWLVEVGGLVAMAGTLASSYPSPWATHYAGEKGDKSNY